MKRTLWRRFLGDISLRKKLLLCFMLLFSIPMLILSVNTFVQTDESLEKQNAVTMENNLNTMVNELEYRFQREETYMKYLAYNLEFREVLEYSADDRSALAMELNDSVEPVLWYYVVSSDYISGVDIFSDRVDGSIGIFLKPSSECEDQQWYDIHNEDFRNIWTCKDGELYASRAILDTKTMNKVLAVMRISFFDSVLSPITDVDYLANGVIMNDADGVLIMAKPSDNAEIDEHVAAQIAREPDVDILRGSEYTLISKTVPTTGWRVYYYVSQYNIRSGFLDMLKTSLHLIIICLVLSLIATDALSKMISRRVLRLRDCAESVAGGDLENITMTDDADEIGVVFNSIGEMAHKLTKSINDLYQLQLEVKAVELRALQAQINPHFLYNSLSSIKWRAIKQGNNDISELTGLLARFYRTSLNDGKQITTVGKEMENISSYVELQRMAHENSFDAEYRVDASALGLPMLNFLLQPIVENAIKHGIDQADESGRGLVEVECALEDEFIIFRIFNNGFTTDAKTLLETVSRPGAGYGIHNIRERIELYYGEGCGVSATVTDDGRTCFTVCILKKCPGAPLAEDVKMIRKKEPDSAV